MTFEPALPFELKKCDGYWKGSFTAMASPCEVLVKCESESEARELTSLASLEAIRIDHKFSRYRDDNIIFAINNAKGEPVSVDDETSRLLNYAAESFQLSDGLFDITSGLLRKAWKFDGQPANPDKALIKKLLNRVGWEKVRFDGKQIRLRHGMEIDLGGLGKEYAVDKVADMVFQRSALPTMVNFGGDLRTVGHQPDGLPWLIGIEKPDEDERSVGEIGLTDGAVATSGDAKRYCTYKGKRLGHILNPRTGWPVSNMPRSVTVIADYCMVAGFLATMAMLSGDEAELFLEEQEVKYHCIR
ncbi:MAG: FAD:protein FMN transferase [Candidatus Zixiibacteriota bacterium]